MSCSCGHSDLDIEQLEATFNAAVEAGHTTAERAAKEIVPVRAAREMAQEIITRLEPRHISGWASLTHVLETALDQARTAQGLGKPGDFRPPLL